MGRRHRRSVLALAAVSVAVVVATAALVLRNGDARPQDVGTLPAARSDPAAVGDDVGTPEPTALPLRSPSTTSVAPVPPPSTSTTTSSTQPEPDEATEPGRLQSASEAEASDNEAIAAARGWTPEEMARYLEAERVIGGIANRVSSVRRDQFVGSALADDPTDPPTLYVKGPADGFIRQLVAEAPIEVRLVDGLPYSSDELDERSFRLHEELTAQGFHPVGVTIDMTTAQIEATVHVGPGSDAQPADIAARLPDDLRVGVTVAVEIDEARDDDFGPLIVFAGAGGNLALGGTGPIEIGEECVRLHWEGRQPTLLGWGTQQVRWSPTDRQILFDDYGRGTVVIEDGDAITVGGSALWSEEDGTPQPDIHALDWVNPPDETCHGDIWIVSGVEVVEHAADDASGPRHGRPHTDPD